jgi:hypothetical protein
LFTLIAVAAAGCGGSQSVREASGKPTAGNELPAGRSAAGEERLVTLRHPPTGFSIRAPEGFGLSFNKGVYVLRSGTLAMSFSRSVSDVTPWQFGTALVRQLGGKVLAREWNHREFAAQLDRGGRGEAFVVVRSGARLAVTTSSAPISVPVALSLLRRVGSSARGGVALRAPKGRNLPVSIPLTPYRTPDGGATALVPAEPGWAIGGGNGVVQGANLDRGSFIYGAAINIFTPERAPPGLPPNILVHPFVNAADALRQVIPKLYAARRIRIRQVLLNRPFPTFSSSAVFLYDYQVNGRPWTGVALIATDSPARYGGLSWLFYHSAIGVPKGTDPSVGVGLLRSWRSWDPSQAITERYRRMIQLLKETNEIWRQTNEYRARAADRQSRDVGCLLLGYYYTEDNSRRYDLPPAPCGQEYG